MGFGENPIFSNNKENGKEVKDIPNFSDESNKVIEDENRDKSIEPLFSEEDLIVEIQKVEKPIIDINSL